MWFLYWYEVSDIHESWGANCTNPVSHTSWSSPPCSPGPWTWALFDVAETKSGVFCFRTPGKSKHNIRNLTSLYHLVMRKPRRVTLRGHVEKNLETLPAEIALAACSSRVPRSETWATSKTNDTHKTESHSCVVEQPIEIIISKSVTAVWTTTCWREQVTNVCPPI